MIEDQKAPTPYCISVLSTAVMNTNGEVVIWASDFLLDATDNCTRLTWSVLLYRLAIGARIYLKISLKNPIEMALIRKASLVGNLSKT